MKAHEYILSKQIQWALNRGIKLIGSKRKRGRPSYVPNLDENLFMPLDHDVLENFSAGDGNELSSADNPGKMQAVHSSSALGVNIFHYWKFQNQIPVIAAACGFCRKGNNISWHIVFEDKYPISEKFQFSPNIDVVIHNSDKAKFKRFAIECKFSEAYGGRRHGGLDEKYLQIEKIWEDIPDLHSFGKSISPDDESFKHLHPAQLIKHILGLKRQFGKNGFRLLYLWYDVPGEEGARNRKEIEAFTHIAKRDSIKFHALSYQKLIIKLANEYRNEHGEYARYLTERYL